MMLATAKLDHAPDRDCPRCPRLVAFRAANRASFPDWWNGPVPAWGAMTSRLLIVGLAPGLRGANRTMRPFTGDYAGDTLYGALLQVGLARGQYGASREDGLALVDCRVTNAVRCVPPANKPVGAEINQCRPFLEGEMAAMPQLAGILALGVTAHQAVVRSLGLSQARYPFRHGGEHVLPQGRWLIDSYHCSRYNTNTRRLTPAMFMTVIERVAQRLAAPAFS